MKRTLDFIIALTLLIVLFPLLIILYVLTLILLGKPALFVQQRAGKFGKTFSMVKFRTMLNAKDKHGNNLPDDERVTKFGKFLRSTSLDELPELWNVLTGDMSLVGPRPLLLDYLPLYSKQQNRRHEVQPGITGWAQINGRNQITWEERFELDVWYVDNQTFILDLSILLKTLRKVIFREAINTTNDSSMPAFTGSQNKSRALK